jgi:hypothetical protein
MFTEENARENQLLSAKKRKENNAGSKAFREFFNNLLNEKGGSYNGRDATKKELVTARAIKILLDPHTSDKDFLKAFEIIRDTIGEKPIDKISVGATDDGKDELRELLEQRRNESK